MKLRLALLATAAFAGTAQANDCAAPTSRDNQLSLSGIVNTYYPVVPVGATTGGYSSGVTDVVLGPALTCSGCGADALAVGDMVLLAQFQDPSINTSNGTAYGANDGTGRGIITPVQVARFQFLRVTASSVTTAGGTVTLRGGNTNGVDFSFGTGQGPGRLRGAQVIRVPQLANVTLGGTLTAPFFQNGTTTNGQLQQTGGIVVLDVAGTLNLNGQSINVNGRGYRGGGGRQYTGTASFAATDYVRASSTTVTGAHGSKGEGVAGTPRYVNNNGTVIDNGSLSNGGAADGYPSGSVGRGAPGNAGGGGTDNAPTPATTGNSQNTGGGGGGGHGPGGQGGNFNGSGNPGLGGIGLPHTLIDDRNETTNNGVGGIWQMAAMGGGGGAGSANTASAASASGAAGGGIVIIRANAITGTGTISANGASATVGPAGDAAGGGGGGGWIVLAASDQTQVTAPSLLLQAKGGDGGSTTGAGNNSGPGGGGGGGGIAYTTNLTGSVSTDVSGGLAGTAVGTSTGAAAGSAGSATSFASIYHIGVGLTGALGTSSRSVSGGAECVPILTKSYTPTVAASGADRTFVVNVKNPNAGTYPRQMDNINLLDTYPAGVVNAGTPALSNNGNCASVAGQATPGAGSFQATGVIVAGGATCSYTMTVTATGSGTLTNTIAQDAIPAQISGVATVNETPAVASLMFPSAVTGGKTSTVVSDPINSTTNPKRIPGATVDYTITITNNSGSAVDNNTMILSDALPFASVKLFVGNLSGGQPFEFTANASNLTCASCISYSNLASPNVNNDADWTYTPVADGDGADANIRHIRFKTLGSMANATSVAIRYRTIVK